MLNNKQVSSKVFNTGTQVFATTVARSIWYLKQQRFINVYKCIYYFSKTCLQITNILK